MKKTILITLLVCSISLFGQEENKTSQNDELIRSMMRLSTQQLFDTARYYFKNNSFDTAVICYNLLTKSIQQNADIEQQRKLVTIYNNLATISYTRSDLRAAYDYYIKKLLICEKYSFINSKVRTFIDMGAIYSILNQYDMAEQYYLKSLELCNDSAMIVLILSNIGANNLLRGKIDSSFYYLDKALPISKRHNEVYLGSVLNNIGSYYQYKKLYDSAFYYFRESLYVSRNKNEKNVESINLSDIGILFFELNNNDSATYYIDLSNKIAYENKYISKLSENYLALSEIEKSKGRYKNALEYYETYNNLKDSIFNADVYSSVNLIQRQYEVSKTNQQIEELEIDRQLKQNTIHYQRIIMNIVFIVSFLMGFVLFIIIVQNKRLRKAYNVLVDKNIEILELQNGEGKTEGLKVQSSKFKVQRLEVQSLKFNVQSSQPATLNLKPETLNLEPETLNLEPETLNPKPVSISDSNNEKYKNKVLSDKNQKELLSKILSFMENTSIICNPDFSMNTLIDSIQSKHVYVSFVLNHVIKKSFSSFLNSYRIREAQRLFSYQDTSKYTVETVANMMGYKSRNSFNEAFKEITGVTPGFYIKSLHGKQKNEKEN